jgi:circadian clock protein KaiB
MIDTLRGPEPPLEGSPGADRYVLRLYVTGMAPRSVIAIANLRELCDRYLRGRCDVEIVDVYRHPERAREAHLIAAPTLVRLLPLPVRRLIGDLSDEQRVLASLSLEPTGG